MMAWCPRASSCVPHTEGRYRLSTPDGFGPVRTLLTVADDGSRWRGPGENHGFNCRGTEWVRRLGASLRCASLHHGLGLCTHRIQGCGTNVRPQAAGSPRRRHLDRTKRAIVLGAIKEQPGGGAQASRWLCRPSLTAPARAGFSIRVGRDEETRLPGRTKKL